MDLGGALAYWIEERDDFASKWMRRQPSNIPGMLTRNEIVDYYSEKMNFDRGLWPFVVVGCCGLRCFFVVGEMVDSFVFWLYMLWCV